MRALADLAFEHNCDAMIVVDPHSDRVPLANSEALSLLGLESEAELHMQRATELFRHDVPQLTVLSQAAMHQGKAWSNDMRLVNSQDEEILVEASMSVLPLGGREVIAMTLRRCHSLVQLQEVAEANTLHRDGLARWKTIETVFREFERENQLILKAAGEGIYGIDSNGLTTFVNPAAERMLGWSAEKLIGRGIHSLIHHTHFDGTPYPGHECHIHASFMDGKERHIDDEVFWRKDGTAIAVEYTSTPILDEGRLVGAVVIFRDVSERRRSESRLRAALAEVQRLKQRLELENAYLQEEYRAEHNYKEIVGKSIAVRRTIQQIEVVAPTDANVLVTGESGTGKELIARAIHDSSGRKDRPLIRVNCASIPRELFESEFFGHVRGAFTGALNDRAGRFELADGGTLFLDEVGEIPMELQSKLLRVLQEQQFERLGDTVTRNVNVRIIAATNRDLKRAVGRGEFREDLYFRLNVFPVESAPLRERPEDIPVLAVHFLERACKKMNKAMMQFSLGDIRKLQSYSWPGNIRELINVIERSVILSNGSKVNIDLPDIELSHTDDIPARNVQSAMVTVQTEDSRRTHERENIIAALKVTGGKVFGIDGAAELLGLKPTTLASRIKRMSINRHQYVPGG